MKMIKSHLLFVFFFVASLCYSQEQRPDYKVYTPKHFFSKIEFFGGLNISKPILDSIYTVYNFPGILYVKSKQIVKYGYLVGTGLSFQMSEHIELTSRILFEKKGHKGSYDQTWQVVPPTFISGTNTFNVNSSYLTFSMLPKFIFGNRKKISIGLGGYYSRLLKSTFELNYFDGIPPIDVKYDQTNEYKKYDTGILLAAEYNFQLHKKFLLGIHAQVNYGVVNTFDQPLNNEKRNYDIRSIPTSSVKNNDVSLTMSLKRILDKPKEKYRKVKAAKVQKKEETDSIKVGQKPDYNAYAPKKVITEIGVYGGPAFSFLRGNPAVETNEVNKRYLKIGHTVGISATHAFSDKVAIKALALLEKKGGIVKGENTYFDQTTQTLKKGRTKEDYIYTCYSLPLMFAYSFGKQTKSQVGLGPYASYIKKQIVRTTHYPAGSKGIEDQSAFNKDFEWGVAIYISQKFALSKNISLSGSILNVWGLSDTRSIKNYGITKTNNTNFLLGIIFKN